jgi:hypothetical protein
MDKPKGNWRRMMPRRGFVSLTGMASAGLAIAGTDFPRNMLEQVPADKNRTVALAKAGSYVKNILRGRFKQCFYT